MASSSMTLGIVSLLALGIQISPPFEIQRDVSESQKGTRNQIFSTIILVYLADSC